VLTVRSPGDECNICFEGITAATKSVTPCGHMFHNDCIAMWQTQKNECGACKTDLQVWTPENSSSNADGSSSIQQQRKEALAAAVVT
jgi:Ring finger domain